jgi:AcrR family transcriptional regulator
MSRKSASGTGQPRAAKAGARQRRTTYHHGALREALLEAADALLADVGIEGFTLRECARRAGVSHGAPAHHFGDARGLLSELTAQSFDQLDALTRRYRTKAAPDALSQLEASGLAYVDYALSHPARFQLMFRTRLLDSDNERLVTAGSRVYRHLEENIAAVSAEAGAPDVLLAEKRALAWSLVHGFANLALDNAGFADDVGPGKAGALRTVSRLIQLTRAGFESAAVEPLA